MLTGCTGCHPRGGEDARREGGLDSDVHPRRALHARQRRVRRAAKGELPARSIASGLPGHEGRSALRWSWEGRRHRRPRREARDGFHDRGSMND